MTTQTTLELIEAIENYLTAEQAFANDGAPENYAAWSNAEAQLKGVMKKAKGRCGMTESTFLDLPKGWHISELCERRDGSWIVGIFHWDENRIKHATGKTAYLAIGNAAKKVEP